MAEHRPFPPSARRLALARAAGIHAASPILVAGAALAALVLALHLLGDSIVTRLGGWVAAACDGRATLTAPMLGRALLALALPALAVVAVVAVVVHLGQTRAAWLPRRQLPGAPQLPDHRVRRAGLDLTGGFVIGGVTFAWLWAIAPRLATLESTPLAAVAVIVSFLATVAIAWIALGVTDAVVRHAGVATALRMTATERKDDARLAGGTSGRWRQRRMTPAAGPSRDAIAGASVIVLGDDVAVAVSWDPIHRPVPICTAVGRAARARQVVALARRHVVPIHREATLAADLATEAQTIPERLWPRLAEILAATRGRDRRR